MRDKKTFGFLSVLQKLSQGQTICVKELSEELDTSIRTAQRYIVDVGDFFGKESLVLQKKGCYRAKNVRLFEKVLIKKSGATSELFIDFFGEDLLNESITPQNKAFIKKELEKNKKIYKFNTLPIANLSYGTLITLKEAILSKRLVSLDLSSRFSNLEYIMPLKLVFEQSELVLAYAMQDYPVSKKIKFVPLSTINSVQMLDEAFEPPIDALEYIMQNGSTKSLFGVEEFKVGIEVSPALISRFRNEKPLHRQHIIGINEKGWVDVEFYSNNPYEVYDILKEHIPNIKIKYPESIKASFLKLLKDFIGSHDN